MKTRATEERRRFLRALAGSAAAIGLGALRPPAALGFGTMRPPEQSTVKRFAFAQLRYPGDWNPYPTAAAELVSRRCRRPSGSARCSRSRATVTCSATRAPGR